MQQDLRAVCSAQCNRMFRRGNGNYLSIARCMQRVTRGIDGNAVAHQTLREDFIRRLSPSLGADPAADMETKRKAEVGLTAGMTLDKSNAAMAEGLIPPEILNFYKAGDYTTKVESWPDGQFKFDADFLKANEENVTKLDVNDAGLMIDKASGQYPEHVYGNPFPKIDKNDPKAAT